MASELKKLYSPNHLLLALLSLIVPLFMLMGCGGDNAPTSSNSGTVFIDVTDAEGDFNTYEVDLTSILLTKADGSQVEVLPNSTRINFTDVIEQSEFIAAEDIPQGRYTQAVLRLDYSNSDVQVEVNGKPVSASVIDSDGNSVTQLDVEIVFDSAHPLVIRSDIAAQATFDFDLAASHTVDTSSNPTQPLVTVEPFIVATIDNNAPKQQRLRGPLASIDNAQQQFTLAMRPFRHHRTHFGRPGKFREVTVATDSTTEFEVDGEQAQGTAGFALLTAKPLTTAVFVYGTLDRANKRFKATTVNAGSTVPGGNLDVLRGDIIARDATKITVRGTLFIRDNASISRNIDVDIALPTQTIDILSANKTVPPAGTDSLSVGQRITAFGEMLATIQIIGTHAAMDISNGHVRVHHTHLLGTTHQITTTGAAIGDSFNMNLLRINKRSVAVFDFTNTGSDPTNYQVQAPPAHISTHIEPTIANGKLIAVTGKVVDFGKTPPDFIASRVLDLIGNNAVMGVNWIPATSSAFSDINASGLTLDMSTAGSRHHILQGDILTPLNTTPVPQIIPNVTQTGKFALHTGRRIRMFKNFSAFIKALDTRLQQGAQIRNVHAKGSYDTTTQTITAKSVFISIRPAPLTPVD